VITGGNAFEDEAKSTDPDEIVKQIAADVDATLD